MEQQLNQLLIEEEQLQLTILSLKKSFEEVGKVIRTKEEQSRLLTRRVVKLKERAHPLSINFPPPGLAINHVAGGKDALLIFPEEVWKLILGNVKDSKDLWNCCLASHIFDTILSSWKTGWLLLQALPNLYRHLPPSKFLECRLVCKSWSSAVEGFVENHPSLQPHNGEADPCNLNNLVYPVKQLKLCEKNIIDYDRSHKRFLHEHPHFPVSPRPNPFLGRYVIVRYDNELREDQRELKRAGKWWKKFLTFLESYGKEIWYFSIFFNRTHTDWTKEKLQELFYDRLFQLLPNVRKLTMTVCYYYNDVVIDNRSLPPAPKLETVEADGLEKPFPILNCLLTSYHNQLRKLKVSADTWEDVSHLEWPNLKELHLKFHWTRGNEQVKDLCAGKIPPNLTKLGLILNDMTGLPAKLVEFINLVASASPLNTVRLQGDGNTSFGERYLKSPNSFVSPAVKTIEIIHGYISGDYGSFIRSYDFLAKLFPFVENVNVISEEEQTFDFMYFSSEISMAPVDDIKWFTKYLVENSKEEILEVNRYVFEGDMYKSNIWVWLPRLKVFTCLWDVYTREDYEKYQKNRVSSSEN